MALDRLSTPNKIYSTKTLTSPIEKKNSWINKLIAQAAAGEYVMPFLSIPK
jgi:hypothetical protein